MQSPRYRNTFKKKVKRVRKAENRRFRQSAHTTLRNWQAGLLFALDMDDSQIAWLYNHDLDLDGHLLKNSSPPRASSPVPQIPLQWGQWNYRSPGFCWDLRDQGIVDFADLNAAVNLSQAFEINLSHNELSHLEWTQFSPYLTSLNLAHNAIVELRGLENCPALQLLVLDGNSLATFDAASLPTNLQYLALGNNKLQEIRHLDHLEKLEELDLHGNHLETLPSLEGMSNLERLDVRGNDIRTVEVPKNLENLFNPTSLPLLFLEGNPLERWLHRVEPRMEHIDPFMRTVNQIWTQLETLDRDYYRTYHGFDPLHVRIPSSEENCGITYVARFPLQADPFLDDLGVSIEAQTIVSYEDALRDIFRYLKLSPIWIALSPIGQIPGRVSNRIVLRRGNQVGEISCVHTAIYAAPIEDIREWQEEDVVDLAQSTERYSKPIHLQPEEHFVALKSYVAGIAEIGLVNMMSAQYYADEEASIPMVIFGFNEAIKHQVLYALQRALGWNLFRKFQDHINRDCGSNEAPIIVW